MAHRSTTGAELDPGALLASTLKAVRAALGRRSRRRHRRGQHGGDRRPARPLGARPWSRRSPGTTARGTAEAADLAARPRRGCVRRPRRRAGDRRLHARQVPLDARQLAGRAIAASAGSTSPSGSCWGWAATRRAELSLASRTGFYDLHARRPWPEALAWADAPPGLAAEPVPAGTPMGHAGAELGRAVLTVGGHDHLAGAVGAGAAESGDVLDSCGTAEAFVQATAPLPPEAVGSAVRSGLSVGWHADRGAAGRDRRRDVGIGAGAGSRPARRRPGRARRARGRRARDRAAPSRADAVGRRARRGRARAGIGARRLAGGGVPRRARCRRRRRRGRPRPHGGRGGPGATTAGDRRLGGR